MVPPVLVRSCVSGPSPYDVTYHLWASARLADLLRDAIKSHRTVHGLTVRRSKDGVQVHYLLSGGGTWTLAPSPCPWGHWGPEAGLIVPLGQDAPCAIVQTGARVWTRAKKRAPAIYCTWSGTEWVPADPATEEDTPC